MTATPDSAGIDSKLTTLALAERLARAQVLVKNYTFSFCRSRPVTPPARGPGGSDGVGSQDGTRSCQPL